MGIADHADEAEKRKGNIMFEYVTIWSYRFWSLIYI